MKCPGIQGNVSGFVYNTGYTNERYKMSDRTKGYVGRIVNGEKLAKIANDIYRLQYSNDFSECTVDSLLVQKVLAGNKIHMVA